VIVLGIDPGLADVGYGVVEFEDRSRGVRCVACGVIRTPAGETQPRRLQTIYRELKAIVAEHRPDAVAIEEIYFAKNAKTAIGVAQGRGAAILATADSGAPLAEYSPPRIKLALVGHGRAGKRQVQMMVRALLGLKEIPKPDHAADALAAALCHLHTAHSLGRRADAQAASQRVESTNKALLAQSRGARRRRR
jgi:crossover junction endodeoxyribonuclease RuvC